MIHLSFVSVDLNIFIYSSYICCECIDIYFLCVVIRIHITWPCILIWSSFHQNNLKRDQRNTQNYGIRNRVASNLGLRTVTVEGTVLKQSAKSEWSKMVENSFAPRWKSSIQKLRWSVMLTSSSSSDLFNV